MIHSTGLKLKTYKAPVVFERNIPFETGNRYGKTVDIKQIQHSTHESVYLVEPKFRAQQIGPNGEVLYLSDLMDEKKARSPYTQDMINAYIKASIPHIDLDAKTLSFIAEDGIALYTIDITQLLADQIEPFDITAVLTNRSGNGIGLSITTDGNPHEARILKNGDLRREDEIPCGDLYKPYYANEGSHPCNRVLGHFGAHRVIHGETDRYAYTQWSDGGSFSTHDYEYGIFVDCVECGLPTLDIVNRYCDTDKYWHDQSTQELDRAFVIDGIHYRPGKGGFDGRTFYIKRHNGITWTGELFTQGPVAPQWRDRIPNNAVFIKK